MSEFEGLSPGFEASSICCIQRRPISVHEFGWQVFESRATVSNRFEKVGSLMSSRLNTLVLLLAVVLLAGWLRAPFVRSGMPYFYDEDEGHHFNRVVNMVKSGDFNPRYFLKPSLHFYLRMPVTSLAFLSAVRAGELRELKEIVTKDNFGLADYSFSASHPKIAKFNRAFSVCFSLLTVILAAIITLQLGFTTLSALGAALLTAVSPALVSSSAVIGVDVIVGPLVLLTVCLTLLGFKRRSSATLLFAALTAGLALSTKYNAGIAVLVPMIAALMMKRWGTAALALVVSSVAFVATSPFLLVELPLFLNHVAYEIWHYGIAGHVGHEAQPGLAQAVHYIGWLRTDGVGITSLLLLFALPFSLLIRETGIGTNLSDRWGKIAIVSAFGVLYFAFMCSQKANFTRNMLVLIPFVAIGAMAGLERLASLSGRFSVPIQRIGILVCALPMLIGGSLAQRAAAIDVTESRVALAQFLDSEAFDTTPQRIGIAGELQLARKSISPKFTIAVFPEAEVQEWLRLNPDVEIVVLPEGQSMGITGWKVARSFPGALLPMRIVRNPALTVWRRE